MNPTDGWLALAALMIGVAGFVSGWIAKHRSIWTQEGVNARRLSDLEAWRSSHALDMAGSYTRLGSLEIKIAQHETSLLGIAGDLAEIKIDIREIMRHLQGNPRPRPESDDR